MGYRVHDDLSLGQGTSENSQTIQVEGQDSIALPDSSYVRDADIMRDGMDLVLDGPKGEIVLENYFTGDQPVLNADDGSSLSPELVNSFVKSAPEYANSGSMFDESPVGSVTEISGEATITRLDGSVESVNMGTEVFQGDIIETDDGSAVNITFSDDSSFAVSDNARMAIDEYVYDPATEAGSQNFSVLKGLFVFTSGLIGRDDPDDVQIDTPVGSIGIRGTIIAGDVDSGEITVVEGAIVLTDFDGNEVTLANQFETAQFRPGQGIEHVGEMAANDVAARFHSVSNVAPGLFSSVNDAAAEAIDAQGVNEDVQPEEMLEQPGENGDTPSEDANPDGSVDQNADNQVDGTVEEAAVESEQAGEAEDEAVGSEDGIANQNPQNVEGSNPLADVAPEVVVWGQTFAEGLGENQIDGVHLQEVADRIAEFQEQQQEDLLDGVDGYASEGDALSDTLGDSSITNTDPRVFEDTTEVVNAAPKFTNNAPNNSAGGLNFFAISDQGPNWMHHFDKEFFDPEGGELTFSATVISGGNQLDSPITINSSDGLLTIDLKDLTLDGSLDIRVTATDDEGASESRIYNFEVFDTGTPDDAIIGTDKNSLDAYSNSSFLTVQSTDSTIFSGSSVGNLIIDSGAQNNDIYISGSGVTTTVSGSTSIGNTIFGGFDSDVFVLTNEGKNTIFGMDGNDVFKIGTNTIAGLQNGGHINGGHNDAGGHDTLEMVGSGALDFTSIPEVIKNIEKIDLRTSASGNDLTLTYGDVFSMTDHEHTLIIDGDGSDSLDFQDEGNSLSYSHQDGSYDVYTDGTITLLLHEDVTSVTGLPAS